MTLKEIYTLLSKLGYPLAYDHFKVGQAPTLPYIVYTKGTSQDVYSDGINYVHKYPVYIDLYQDDAKYDFELEAKLRQFLIGHKVSFNMDAPVWIKDEKLYQTTYQITVVEKEE